MNTEERLYKTSQVVRTNSTKKTTKQEETFLRKYNRWSNSRAVRRIVARKWRDYDKKPDVEKDNQVRQILKDIAVRKEELTKEITEDYIKRGKNVHHAGVWKSIQFQVNKQLTEHYGFNPDNLEGISLASAKRLLFPNFSKEDNEPIETDISILLQKPDDQLNTISRLAKQDPKGWYRTMVRLGLLREAKRKGWISGMYEDSYGKFQF